MLRMEIVSSYLRTTPMYIKESSILVPKNPEN